MGIGMRIVSNRDTHDEGAFRTDVVASPNQPVVGV
jgi:hypothetical protein